MRKFCKIIWCVVFVQFVASAGISDDSNKPLIENQEFWGSWAGQPIVNCANNNCFPKNINAKIGCDARCLFTQRGFGFPEAVDRAFKDKSPVPRGTKPKFIISYGPPASGKSRIAEVLKTRLRDLSLMNDPVSVNVDDIFQGGEIGNQYKNYRREILRKYGSNSTLYTQRLYVYFRWIADQISDSILNLALLGKYNILWETTGGSDWPQREVGRIRNYDYETIVAYPMVEARELLARAERRAITEGQEAAPREQILSTISNAQKNLAGLLPARPGDGRGPCKVDYQFGGEQNCRSDRVSLIDNTGRPNEERIAFDSKNIASYCSATTALNDKIRFEQVLNDELAEYLKGKCGR